MPRPARLALALAAGRGRHGHGAGGAGRDASGVGRRPAECPAPADDPRRRQPADDQGHDADHQVADGSGEADGTQGADDRPRAARRTGRHPGSRDTGPDPGPAPESYADWIGWALERARRA